MSKGSCIDQFGRVLKQYQDRSNPMNGNIIRFLQATAQAWTDSERERDLVGTAILSSG